MGRSADLPRTAGLFDGDDTGCTMLHVDMDAFFASVEIKRRPDLRGKPVVVGGGHRGVVAAASYAARRFGIRSAMPMSQALRLCPRAVVLPPDRAAYTAASAGVMAILRDVTPLVEPLSLDEAFLDVAGAVRAAGRPALIAAAIRARVEAELELTCSVGVAPTKFVAKLASARCKPDGMLVVPATEVLAFLHPLPVTALWGVGARTGESLHRLGIRTVRDLAETPFDTLRRAVGSAGAEHLSALAAGVDPRAVNPDEVEKSISAETTLDTDLTAESDVRRELLRLAEEVGSRVRARGFVSRTVGIKIRFADFRTVTRVRTLPGATTSSGEIYRIAAELYRSLDLDQPRVRLVGVKAEGLRDAGSLPEQLALDLTPARGAPARTAAPSASGRPGPAVAAHTGAGETSTGVGVGASESAVSSAADPAAGASRGAPAITSSRPARAATDTGTGDAVSAAVDAARTRFGDAAVRPGTLLGTAAERVTAAPPDHRPARMPESS